jgi:hypothetical protein
MKKLVYFFLLAAIAVACSKSDSSPVATANGSGTQNNNTNSTGQGGSMARFALSGDHLYIVTDNKLMTYDVSQQGDMKSVGTLDLQGGVETVYAYKQYLYMGTQNGMRIYNCANPASPTFVSNYSHITSCDPVVVNDKYAFVTLRTEATRCNRGQNLLDIVDISNPSYPRTVKSIAMEQPYGLGIDSNTLFVCDKGLKVYDAKDVQQIDKNMVARFSGFQNFFDVIPQRDRKILIAASSELGIYQYDYSDARDIKLISTLPVVQ